MRRRAIIILGCVVVVAVAAAILWRYGILRGTEQESEQASEERPVPVVLAQVEAGTAEELYRAAGELVAADRVTIMSEVRGRVEEVTVEEGARVSRGEVIVRLDSEEALAELEAARARVEEAQAQFERARTLVREEYLAEATFDERQLTLQVARSEASQAAERLQDFTIEAPFDGEIGFIDLSPGAVVEPGQAIAELATTQALLAGFDLPERYVGRIKPSQPVRVFAAVAAGSEEGKTADEAAGGTLGGRDGGQRRPVAEGEIVTIAPVVDSVDRSFHIEAQLSRIAGATKPGQFVTVEVVLSRRQGVPFVPEGAVERSGPTAHVYLVGEESIARRKAVELGERRGDRIEVLDGLNAGDRVVVSGLQKVSDGTPVEPQEATATDEAERDPGG